MTWPLVNYTPRLPSIMCRPATQSPLKDRRRKTSSFIASPYNITNVAFRRSQLAAHRQPSLLARRKAIACDLITGQRACCWRVQLRTRRTSCTIHLCIRHVRKTAKKNRLFASSRKSVRLSTFNNSVSHWTDFRIKI